MITITNESYRGSASDAEATFETVEQAESKLSELFDEAIKLTASDYTETEIEYQVAFVNGSDGSFDVVETFDAADDEAANAYANEHYAGQDWYVLRNGENINA
jgi:hypothetical protein